MRCPHPSANAYPNLVRARRVGGFTLLELLIGLTLLALMMVLMYSALNLGIRAWDVGDARAGAAADQRVLQSFLRRELSQVFAIRWRGIPDSKIAFEGSRQEIRFVSALSLDAGLRDGGLQWGHLQLRDDADATAEHGSKALYLARDAFDMQAKDWSALNSLGADRETRLISGLRELEISYFGAENDQAAPQWSDKWANPHRLPQLIKFRFTSTNRRSIPELIVQLKLGEEAGCYENGFSRQCGPRST